MLRFGKSIKLFLMDGITNGRWMCEISNWTGIVYKIPKDFVKDCNERKDLENIGMYLVFGRNNSTNKKSVYIYCSENIKRSINEDLKNFDFKEIVLFMSQDKNINIYKLRYLYNRLIEIVNNSPKCELLNQKIMTQPHITESEQSEMEEYLHNALILLNIFGYKMFKPDEGTAVVAEPESLQTATNTEIDNIQSIPNDIENIDKNFDRMNTAAIVDAIFSQKQKKLSQSRQKESVETLFDETTLDRKSAGRLSVSDRKHTLKESKPLVEIKIVKKSDSNDIELENIYKDKQKDDIKPEVSKQEQVTTRIGSEKLGFNEEQISKPISNMQVSLSTGLLSLSFRGRNGMRYEATGRNDSEGFVLLKGSNINPIVSKSMPYSAARLRKKYKKNISKDNVLLSDLVFPAPSMAAMFVSGSSMADDNNWSIKIDKKTEDGNIMKSAKIDESENRKQEKSSLQLNKQENDTLPSTSEHKNSVDKPKKIVVNSDDDKHKSDGIAAKRKLDNDIDERIRQIQHNISQRMERNNSNTLQKSNQRTNIDLKRPENNRSEILNSRKIEKSKNYEVNNEKTSGNGGIFNAIKAIVFEEEELEREIAEVEKLKEKERKLRFKDSYSVLPEANINVKTLESTTDLEESFGTSGSKADEEKLFEETFTNVEETKKKQRQIKRE